MIYVYNIKYIYIVQVHIIIHSNNIIMVYETATTTATGNVIIMTGYIAKYILQRTLTYNKICPDILFKT